jgi:hypothetical protein
MRFKLLLYLAAYTVCVSGQADTFEDAEFNVTEALIANGIDASYIPSFDQDSLDKGQGCAIAVSSLCSNHGSCFPFLRISVPL